MKVLYSQLKKYLPELKADYKEVGHVYTMIGYMLDGPAEKVQYNGAEDYMLDLEVRQNRADGFGVIGLARELSAYYNIPLVLPQERELETSGEDLPIEVKATYAVKRVMAVQLENLEIGEPPAWLKEYLELYEINSINSLVDLTNYIMLETAHPSHVFDVDKVGNKLIWEVNAAYKKMTTLNGVELQLPADALVISDGARPLSLSFIGGKEDAVDNQTKKVILEMAVYDGGLVRRNSRQMKTLTEAGQRLEKFMDPASIPTAFNMLVGLILEICGGQVTSRVYDNYIQKSSDEALDIDLDKLQQLAGIEIPYEESVTYLERLGFKILERNEKNLKLKRPIDRLDIEQREDVYEEVIRLKGFYNLPIGHVKSNAYKDVTPDIVKLIEGLYNFLPAQGLDEVRSWVLVAEEDNSTTNYSEYSAIRVENSINDEVPFLRQTIVSSLVNQYKEMRKRFVDRVSLFEIGTVFFKQSEAEFLERQKLAILVQGNNINDIVEIVKKLSAANSVENVEIKKSENAPEIAHPKSFYTIALNGKDAGICFVSNQNITGEEVLIVEMDIEILLEAKANVETGATKELNQKLVALDVNLIRKAEDVEGYVKETLQEHMGSIWSWDIVDRFAMSEGQEKFTVRVTYLNLSDTDAKELHKTLFGDQV